MTRLQALDPDHATGKTKEYFDAIQNKMGMIPNMMRTMGNSPAVLDSYLGFSTAMQHSAISAPLKELIALTVANENGCDYCNAAHTFIGQRMRLSQQEIEDARIAQSEDEKIGAALFFAKRIVENRGAVDNSDVDAVKQAGYSEGEIVEIVAQVSLSIFTNYMNIIAATAIDFPKLEPIMQKV